MQNDIAVFIRVWRCELVVFAAQGRDILPHGFLPAEGGEMEFAGDPLNLAKRGRGDRRR